MTAVVDDGAVAAVTARMPWGDGPLTTRDGHTVAPVDAVRDVLLTAARLGLLASPADPEPTAADVDAAARTLAVYCGDNGGQDPLYWRHVLASHATVARARAIAERRYPDDAATLAHIAEVADYLEKHLRRRGSR